MKVRSELKSGSDKVDVVPDLVAASYCKGKAKKGCGRGVGGSSCRRMVGGSSCRRKGGGRWAL